MGICALSIKGEKKPSLPLYLTLVYAQRKLMYFNFEQIDVLHGGNVLNGLKSQLANFRSD